MESSTVLSVGDSIRHSLRSTLHSFSAIAITSITTSIMTFEDGVRGRITPRVFAEAAFTQVTDTRRLKADTRVTASVLEVAVTQADSTEAASTVEVSAEADFPVAVLEGTAGNSHGRA
jgi:hypothetical protein